MRRNFQRFRHFAVAEHDDVVLGFLDDAALCSTSGVILVVGSKALSSASRLLRSTAS
jgi:hypothetical protein